MAEFTVGIALARLEPMLAKYLQNLSLMSMGCVIVLPSKLNNEGGGGLSLCLFYSFVLFLISPMFLSRDLPINI